MGVVIWYSGQFLFYWLCCFMLLKKILFFKQDICVLLLEGVSQIVVEVFSVVGYSQIEVYIKVLFEDELKECIVEVYIVGICLCIQFSVEVLVEVKCLIVVGCFCIGINQVDLDVVELVGILVFNVFYFNICSVVELVIVEVIMLIRGILQKNVECYCGGWLKLVSGSYEVCGKMLGIIGYGYIGIQVGVFVELLGMQVIFYDVEIKLVLGNVCVVVSLDDLLVCVDIVILYVLEMLFMQWMIGSIELVKMCKGVYLINVVCGIVVDIDVLDVVLVSGYVGGVVLDVFLVELKGNGDIFELLLICYDNVIFILYVGGSMLEVQDNIGVEVVVKLVCYSDNGSILLVVNFLEVILFEYEDSLCLLYIYQNVLGVLFRVNEIFLCYNVNIDGQFLCIDLKVGYVVIDIIVSEVQVVVVCDELVVILGMLWMCILY